MTSTTFEDAVALMRMEYAELPGLTLTPWQAQRLWDLSQDVCDHALATLVTEGVLVRTISGEYARQFCFFRFGQPVGRLLLRPDLRPRQRNAGNGMPAPRASASIQQCRRAAQ